MKLTQKIHAQTVLSESCERAAFKYWMVGQKDPHILICGSPNLAIAAKILLDKFGDRFDRAELIRAEGNLWQQ